MSHVVIVGGGFAGVWSAAAAARVRGSEDLRITLVAPGKDLVLRPRLYEPEPARATVALKRILEPVGVEHVRAVVQDIDVDGRVVIADGRPIEYGRSSSPRAATSSGRTFRAPSGCSTWTRWRAPSGSAATCGAGTATRPSWSAPVSPAWRSPRNSPGEAASSSSRRPPRWPRPRPGPRPAIEVALDRLGIERRLGTTVAEVLDGGAVLADGSRIPADAVVWTAGLEASPLTSHIPGEHDHLGRLKVDAHLRAHPHVFAAGDVAAARADQDHWTVQSCQHATPMGKTAGHNAAADLLGVPLVDFAPAPYVTDVDLGAAGAVYTRGWDRRIALSGAEGKWVKRWLMDVIHPPVDDAPTILAHAGMITTPIPF